MSWIEVRAILPESDDRSSFVEIFRDHGIESTQEEGDALFGCLPNVAGTEGRIEALKGALVSAGATDATSREFPEQNWDAMWRQFFHPRRIGRRIVVRPTWEEFVSGEGDVVIVLDPGEAFGTGDHATTRLCLELVEDAAERLPAGFAMADLGCGSGILAIAAAKLGAGRIDAVDLDPTSVEVARKNATLNEVEFDLRVGDGLRGFPQSEPYDLIVSNIISAVLIGLAPEAAKALRPGGDWVVSGILQDNWPLVATAARNAGFQLIETRSDGEWMAAVLRAK